MNRWGPPTHEVLAAVERCGCRVNAVHRMADGDEAHEIDCPSEAARVALLSDLAELDARMPEVLRLSRELAGQSPDRSRAGVASYLHGFVRDRVVHMNEPRELFRPTLRTLAEGIGDCDDSARALTALFRSVGLRSGVATLGTPPRHVASVVELGDRWYWAETSLRGAELGEHPLDAADRLGLRTDPALAGDDTDPRAEVAAFAAVGLLSELVTALLQWRKPTVGSVVGSVVAGAYSPLVIRLANYLVHGGRGNQPPETPVEPHGSTKLPEG